jgi:hypothetical protein
MDVFDFVWNLRQQQQIDGVAAKASAANADSMVHEASLADLSSRFERLALVTQAVWELLSERAQVSPAELVAKINEVDARSGTRDGRLSALQTCQKCGHAVAASRRTCLYCGAPMGPSTPFSGL